jgi:hypothetical protein
MKEWSYCRGMLETRPTVSIKALRGSVASVAQKALYRETFQLTDRAHTERVGEEAKGI